MAATSGPAHAQATKGQTPTLAQQASTTKNTLNPPPIIVNIMLMGITIVTLRLDSGTISVMLALLGGSGGAIEQEFRELL